MSRNRCARVGEIDRVAGSAGLSADTLEERFELPWRRGCDGGRIGYAGAGAGAGDGRGLGAGSADY